MSFLKSFIARSVAEVNKPPPPPSPDAAGIFFFGQAPTAEAIKALAYGAETSITELEGKTRISAVWPDVTVNITIDPTWDKASQVEGLRGWVNHFPSRVRAKESVQQLVASFDNIVTCYGSVSLPEFDAAGKAVKLLTDLLGNTGGFFYSRNSFYDAQGNYITGFDDAPAKMGLRPELAE